MTFRGSRGFGSAVTLLGILSCTLLLWRVSVDEASAQTTYVTWDWVITNGTVTLENETVDVLGNVTVGEGGRLVLVNSTLILNTSRSGQDVLVDEGGSLRSVDSVIHGGSYDSFLTVWNDSELIRTEVRYFNGHTSLSGIQLENGYVDVVDSYISTGVRARTDVSIVNSSVRYGLRLCYRQPNVDRDITWTVRDLDPAAWGFPILIDCHDGPVNRVVALIENMAFHDLDYGISMILDSGLDIRVSNCTFVRTKYSISVREADGGRAEFVNNTIYGGYSGSSTTGFDLQVTGLSSIILRDNTVERVRTAYILSTRVGPDLEYSVGNLSARDCTYALSVRSDYTQSPAHFLVTVHNSTFERMSLDFWVGRGCGLNVYDTECLPGSGHVYSDGLYLRAFTLVDIGSVAWRDGPPIGSGRLLLLGNGSAVVASMDIAALEPMLLMAWEYSPVTHTCHEVLTPSISQDGCRFNGTPFDPWEKGPVDLEIIDDRPPLLSIESPSMGSVYNRDHITATGACVERGLGLADLIYTVGDNEPAYVSETVGSRWSLPLEGLREGEVVLSLYATDMAGNEAVPVSVIFTIDTIAPCLEIDPPPDLTTSSDLVVTGRTEPRASLMVNGVVRSVKADGSFAVALTLLEGLNHISVFAEDGAGNYNGTQLEVRLDTTPPYLLVESPWNGTWITAWEVLVRGETEPGAHLEIDGEVVELIGGSFEHVVRLPFGEHRMSIDVRDRAGNAIHRVIVLFADWEAPRLSIESPNRTTVYTNVDTVFVLGTVEEEHLDRICVNGEPLVVLDGTFLAECDLEPGRNVLDVRARDLAGNENRVKLVVVLDVEHPECSCDVEAVGGDLRLVGNTWFSSTPRIRLSVTASEQVIVSVAQRRVGPSTKLLVDLDLEEGRNDLTVVVADRAGNEVIPLVYEVLVDTVPPDLTVHTSLIGERTEDDTVTVYGNTEAGVRLIVAGVQRSVRYDGTFEEDLPLAVGLNEFVISVTDTAGNTNSVTVTVKRVEPEPEFGTAVVGLSLLLVSAVVMLVILCIRYLRAADAGRVT